MNLKNKSSIQNMSRNNHLNINLLLSEGKKYMRLMQFEKAITWFDKILQENANHLQSLLGKAKCCMNLGRYSEACVEFDKVLNLNPKCAEAINLKGIAEYCIGDFEQSFITHWHGYKIRPFCDYLRMGYGLSKKTIENNLNAEERMVLTDKEVAKLTKLLLRTDIDTSKKYHSKGLYSADLKLLDDMCKDKTLQTLHSSCADLLDYLKGRQKFWKMQEPYKKIDRSNSSIFIKNSIYDSIAMNKLLRNFGLCWLALNERKTSICINKGNQVLSLLKTIKEDFPGKIEIETGTLHYLVMAYLIQQDFETSTKYCTKLYNVADERDLQNIKGKALRNFGEIYYNSNKYIDSLNYFEESLQFTEDDEEKSAILYKISDCNVHLNKLKDATDAAEKCLKLVVGHRNFRFQVDALLLLAEISVKRREMKIAEEHYRNALAIAMENNDTRKKDLENLLKIFEEVSVRDSYSKERTEIIRIADNIKHT